MSAPCMNCPDREIGCHGYCERYKTFQEEHAKAKAQEREQKELDWAQNRREHAMPKRVDLSYQKARASR